MIMYSNKNGIVLVATVNGNNCPSLKLSKSSAVLQDDFSGRLASSKRLVRKLF